MEGQAQPDDDQAAAAGPHGVSIRTGTTRFDQSALSTINRLEAAKMAGATG